MTRLRQCHLRSREITVLATLVGVTTSCGGPQNMMSPGGPAAHRIASLGWIVLITFAVVTAVMWGLVFWAAARRKGSLATHLPHDAPEDRRWIIIGGFTIPVVILAVIFAFTLRTMASFPMGDNEMNAAVADVRVTGHQWWWEVQYLQGSDVKDHVNGANEIHIPVGRPVTIELRSNDVIHSFWVPRLHGKVDLIPAVVNRIRIQADQPGVYRGECAEYCGPQHAHMILYVRADPEDAFEAWLTHARQPAAAPSDEFARRGQQLFMARACILCHTIAGTDAQGKVGPDLTHVASRLGIAANAVSNSTGNLQAWVTHAQSVKPYARMPNLTAFTGEEARALVAYLQTLR